MIDHHHEQFASADERAMATRIETNVVYAAGLVQGIVLVNFPRRARSSPIPTSTTSPAASTARCSCRR